MIIVFTDDQLVTVLRDLDAVRDECEAIDVEDGCFQFFDEFGRRLIPRFTKPVERTTLIFGIQSVGGGVYELDIDPVDPGSAFEELLANVVAIEPNPWFKTITALDNHVAGNRGGVTN